MSSKVTIVNHPHDLRRGVDFIGITCVFFCHDGHGNYLLNKRSHKCRDEVGRWDPGGGAMEFGETPQETISREVREEYCVQPKELQRVTVFNVLRVNNGLKTHWVAFVYLAKVDRKKVRIGDPDKIDEIGWFTPDSLPSPLHSQFNVLFPIVLEKNQSIS